MHRKKLKVVIADDHANVRTAVRKLLEKTPDIVVIGEAANGKEAVSLVEALGPDLLILDLQMPIMGGVEALTLLRQQGCPMPVLILSGDGGGFHASLLLDLGASGYLVKEKAPEHIAEMVRKIIQYHAPGMISATTRNDFLIV